MLRLRPYNHNDAEIIVGWLGGERAFRQWCAEIYDHYPITAADMDAYYRKALYSYPMIALDEDGVAAHLCLRYVDQEEKEVRFGFVIVDPAKRGKGYGRELLQLAAKYAMIFLGAEKISLVVFEENARAYACYLTAGFRDETREELGDYVFQGETWHYRKLELNMSREEPEGTTGILALARRDVLTGLYNQQGMLEQLERWKEICLERGEKLLLVSADIDRLRNINNVYGHSEGDVAIQTMAEILKDSLSEKEAAARVGGDEFVIAMLVDGEAERMVDSLIHAIKGRLDNYNRISDKEYNIELNHSYLVLEPDQDTKMQDALDDAFNKKRIMKNNHRTNSTASAGGEEQDYDPAEEKSVNEILDKNSFRYDFQPIVDARTGDIYGYEALMRAGQGDSVSPYVILKYAIKCQRLYDVERATFGNVLSAVVGKRGLFEEKKVFLNSIPGYQLDYADYEKIRREYGDVLRQLVVEVIEQSELNDKELDILLQRSKEDGFDIAIDDYGTGYSNTSTLLRYLPNCLKIDRMLISNIQDDPKKQHFVKAIIEFAHDNGFLALAEGVETAEEMKEVIHMGIDLIQGYYTARPSAEIIQKVAPEIKDEIVSILKDNKGQETARVS